MRLTCEARRIRCPSFGNLLEQAGEPWTAPSIVRRKVCAGKEWLLVRREENRHGPSALPMIEGHRGLHVNFIEIGAFFPIDFDTDKMRIHQCRNRFVLKRFPLHDVTPMTGGISD